MQYELIAQIVGSNFPTVLSVVALLLLLALYWWKVIPEMEKLRTENASLRTDLESSQSRVEELEEGQTEGLSTAAEVAIQQLTEDLNKLGLMLTNRDGGSSELLSEVKGTLDSVSKICARLRSDSSGTSESVSDILQSVHEIQGQLHRLHQRVHSLTSAVYSTNPGGQSDRDRLTDLRTL